MAAPEGIRHGKATTPFVLVEQIRDDREYRGMTLRQLVEKYGIPKETLRDWIYYRTRARA